MPDIAEVLRAGGNGWICGKFTAIEVMAALTVWATISATYAVLTNPSGSSG